MRFFFLIFIVVRFSVLQAQITLTADGTTDTYTLINSVLAPGYNAIEVPDCEHPDFGDHIDQIYDNELGKFVFRFHIHKNYDSDRCIKYDRQRNEIKTYSSSPDNLKAVLGEQVEYKWKFKLDEGFQPSTAFSHIHQIKAVGGEDADMPLITFTARKSSPDRLEIRYTSGLDQGTLHKVPLDPFKGRWVEVTELITYAEIGKYNVEIRDISSGEVLMNYNSDNIRTWKTDAVFLRPKWGIYRSLNDIENLRDEEILFSDFSIEELNITSAIKENKCSESLTIFPNPVKHSFVVTNTKNRDLIVFDLKGNIIIEHSKISEDQIEVANLNPGVYLVQLRNGNVVSSSKVVVGAI